MQPTAQAVGNDQGRGSKPRRGERNRDDRCSPCFNAGVEAQPRDPNETTLRLPAPTTSIATPPVNRNVGRHPLHKPVPHAHFKFPLALFLIHLL